MAHLTFFLFDDCNKQAPSKQAYHLRHPSRSIQGKRKGGRAISELFTTLVLSSRPAFRDATVRPIQSWWKEKDWSQRDLHRGFTFIIWHERSWDLWFCSPGSVQYFSQVNALVHRAGPTLSQSDQREMSSGAYLWAQSLLQVLPGLSVLSLVLLCPHHQFPTVQICSVCMAAFPFAHRLAFRGWQLGVTWAPALAPKSWSPDLSGIADAWVDAGAALFRNCGFQGSSCEACSWEGVGLTQLHTSGGKRVLQCNSLWATLTRICFYMVVW